MLIEPSVQSECKREPKEGDQPGNDLFIMSAHRQHTYHP